MFNISHSLLGIIQTQAGRSSGNPDEVLQDLALEEIEYAADDLEKVLCSAQQDESSLDPRGPIQVLFYIGGLIFSCMGVKRT